MAEPTSSPRLMQQDAAQADLFKRTTGPEGFRYQSEIMSPKEECVLVARIAALPLAEFLFQGFAAKRRVLSFGWRYDFERGRFEKTESVPGFLLDIRTRAAAFAGLKADDLPHALVTEYSPGTPIGWHKDRPQFEDVLGISLLSVCTFRLRCKQGSKWQRYSFTAEPRSIYLMQGPSRWEWEHSIPPVETLRYSITFRSLRKRE